MAITYTNSGNVTSGGNWTLGAGSRRLLMVFLMNPSNNTIPTGTYDSKALTVAASYQAAACAISLAYYLVPDADSGVKAIGTTNSEYQTGVVELAGVDTITPTSNATGKTSGTNSTSTGITSAAGTYCLEGFVFPATQTAINAGASQTVFLSEFVRYINAYKAITTDSATMSWSGTYSAGAYAIVTVKPAIGGTQTVWFS